MPFLRQSSTVTELSQLALKCQITSINLIPTEHLDHDGEKETRYAANST